MDELRACIRALVGVIQSASARLTTGSPVDDGQLAQVRKVVRLLSLSQDQIDAMPSAERSVVLSIRNSAVQKMKVHSRLRPCRSSSHTSTCASSYCRVT